MKLHPPHHIIAPALCAAFTALAVVTVALPAPAQAIKRPVEAKQTLHKFIPKYKQKKGAARRKSQVSEIQNDIDTRSIRDSASKDLKYIIVLLAEIPLMEGRKPVIAPVFMTDNKKIFGTRTDFSFNWVGYKMTMKFRQNNFPFRNTSLQEVLIGSFLYASGTNLGFVGSSYQKETRFYTNYTSEMLIFRWRMAKYLTTGYGFDSRQYFFIRRETPEDFRMPKNHVNIFPFFIMEIGSLEEHGIDQLTQGIMAYAWGGYGWRSRWGWWGESTEPQSGAYARDFAIFSAWLKFGLLYEDNHNLVVRLLYKSGVDNDFLNRPRFGGTIDNARLDVVHGYPLDYFRVNSFCLTNISYGFNIFSRLRLNLYFDYAHIFIPRYDNVIGFGYGFRITMFYGIPLWVTHGMGKRIFPGDSELNHTIMIMTAAGW